MDEDSKNVFFTEDTKHNGSLFSRLRSILL